LKNFTVPVAIMASLRCTLLQIRSREHRVPGHPSFWGAS
jgi:hypothetical protein